jgi:hypothetical protein
MNVLQDEVDAAGLAYKWTVQSVRLPGLLVTKIIMRCCDERLFPVVYRAVVKPTSSEHLYTIEVNGTVLKSASRYWFAVMVGVRELIKLAGLCEALAEGTCN